MAEDGPRKSHAEEKQTDTNKDQRSDIVDDLETRLRTLNLDDSNKRTSEPDEKREKDQQGKTSVIAEETGQASAGPDKNKETVRNLPVGPTTSDNEQNLGTNLTAASSTEGNSEIVHSPPAGPNSYAGANGDFMQKPSDVLGVDADKNISSQNDQGTEPECTKSKGADQHPCFQPCPAADTTSESGQNSPAKFESSSTHSCTTTTETVTSQATEPDLAANTTSDTGCRLLQHPESAPESDSKSGQHLSEDSVPSAQTDKGIQNNQNTSSTLSAGTEENAPKLSGPSSATGSDRQHPATGSVSTADCARDENRPTEVKEDKENLVHAPVDNQKAFAPASSQASNCDNGNDFDNVLATLESKTETGKNADLTTTESSLAAVPGRTDTSSGGKSVAGVSHTADSSQGGISDSTSVKACTANHSVQCNLVEPAANNALRNQQTGIKEKNVDGRPDAEKSESRLEADSIKDEMNIAGTISGTILPERKEADTCTHGANAVPLDNLDKTSDFHHDSEMGGLNCTSSGKKQERGDFLPGTEGKPQESGDVYAPSTMSHSKDLRRESGSKTQRLTKGELFSGKENPEGDPRKRFEVQNRHTQCLDDLGFKRHCEEENKNIDLTIEFDHKKNCIIVNSTSDFSEKVMIDVKKFREGLAKLPLTFLTDLEQALIEKPAVQEFVSNELLKNRIRCHFKKFNGGLKVVCLPAQSDKCVEFLKKCVCSRTFKFKNQQNPREVVKDLNLEEFAVCDVQHINKDICELHVAAILNVAPELFRKVEKAIPHDRNVRESPSLLGKSGPHSPQSQICAQDRADAQNAAAENDTKMRRLSGQREDQLQHSQTNKRPELPAVHKAGCFVTPKSPANVPVHQLPDREKFQALSFQSNAPSFPLTMIPHGSCTLSASPAIVTGSNSQPHGTPEVRQGASQFAGQTGKIEQIQTDTYGDKYKQATELKGVKVRTDKRISEIVKRNKAVQDKILAILPKKGVHLDGNDIENGLFFIAHGKADSVDEVHRLLSEFFITCEFPEYLMDELRMDIAQVLRDHPDTCSLTFSDQKKRWILIYYCEIFKQIKPVLFKLRYKEMRIPLPGYLLSHVHQMVKDLQNSCNVLNQGNCQKEIWFSAMTDSDRQFGLTVTSERKVAAEVKEEVLDLLEKLTFREEDIDSGTGHVLQAKKGMEYIKAMEQEHHSTVHIQTPGNRVLLHGWSPDGHQVMLCEGRLTDADVLVIPLCDGQKDWPPAHQRILEKSFLSSSLKKYAQVFRSQGQQKTLHLNCSGDLAGKKVVLMAVTSDEKIKHNVREALTEILQSVESNTTVGVPLHLGSDVSLKATTKTILHTLTEKLAEEGFSSKSLVVKLYLESRDTADAIDLRMLVEHLTNKSWASSGYFKPFAEAYKRVRVVVEELLSKEADVLVNSTDPDLTHTKGTVSSMLLEKTGKELTDQCQRYYPKGLSENVVAVTSSCGLKNFIDIFHIALPQLKWPQKAENMDMETENELLGSLKVHVQSCLTLASAKGFQSIVFPSLGTGILQYPPQKVAQTMFTAIGEFFKEMPNSSLKHVFICCYHKDTETKKAFQAVETFFAYGVCTPWNKDPEASARGAMMKSRDDGILANLKGDVKDSIVQVVQGDAQLCKNADLVIFANSRKREHWKAFKNLPNSHPVINLGRGLKDDIKKALENVKDSSTVQIFLETFETKHFTHVVQGVVKGLTKHQHVVLVVPEDEFEALIPFVKSGWKNTVCYPVEGLDASSLWRTASHVQVCGGKNQAKKVLEKIREMKVQQQDIGSPVDPHPAKGLVNSQAAEGLDSGDDTWEHLGHEELAGQYTFSIPLKCLKRENQAMFLKEVSQFKTQIHEPSVKFYLNTREEWKLAFEQVHEYIREHGEAGKPEGSLSRLQQQSQDQGHSVLTRELDSVVAGSLKVLMKEDFGKVKEEQIGNDKVKLSCSGPTAQEIMNKMDSLRQEEMQLGPEDMPKILAPMDTREEGVEAYMVPVPHQGKVIIFSFDYNAVSKAKHLLNVKLGKVKVTARARRRFEGKNDSGGDEASSHSPPSSLGHKSSTANAAEFNTKSGIKVSVYKTDITKLPVDAIVNAANENLAHGGGVAYAIARAAGYELEDEGQDYIRKHGPLKVRGVVATTAGSLPCKKVLHAVGPRWYDYKDKALCQQHLVDTVYNCLHKANSMQLTSLAIPSISAAIFGVPKEVCAVSYLSAVQSFDKDCGRDTRVRHVHFVDVNDDMINAVQENFKQNWNTDMSSKRQEVRKGSAPAAAQQDLMSNTGSHSTRSDGSRLTLAAESEDGLSSFGKNILHPAGMTESLRLEVYINNRGENECHYYFQDLALQFKCQNVTEPYTDALVLWQEIGNLAMDQNFRQYKATLSTTAQAILSRSTSNMTSAGYVSHVELDAAVVLFPVVSSYSALTADKVQEMVASCLDKVDWFHKASVAIPTYPRTLKDSKEPNLAVTNFAVGLFRALKNSSKTLKSVKQIHVISPDRETIQFITETVSQQLAIEKSLHDTLHPSVSGSGQAEPVTDDCVICRDPIKKPKALKCGHTFCTECVDKWLYEKSRCPTCKRVHGTLIGNQPSNGRMEMRSSVTALPGYEECGSSLVINYSFNDGMQTAKHPQPGTHYRGISRKAYLPNTREGRTVLMLLKTAFDRLLIFTVDKSSTTGHLGIIWNDIHHKTSQFGGTTKHGYPDSMYLTRVTTELADNGVTKEDLTDTQTDFIENPEKYIVRTVSDFSYHFMLPSRATTVV